MFYCAFQYLIPGMVLGQPVFTDDGTTLLEKGTVLTSDLVKKLRERTDITDFVEKDDDGVPVLSIDSFAPVASTQSVVDTAFEKNNITGEFLEKMTASEPSENATDAVADEAEKPAEKKQDVDLGGGKPTHRRSNPKEEMLLDLDYVDDYRRVIMKLVSLFAPHNSGKMNLEEIGDMIAEGFLNKLCDGARAVTQIHNMQRDGDYLLHHSLHVAILAGLMGRWLRWPIARRQRLILAGLFHDVGKLKISKDILDKPGRLTPSERVIINKHPIMSHDILMHSGLSGEEEIICGVLQHHERCDGSGYPSNLKGDEIGEFGRILAILDIYDAMATNRSYAHRSSPFDIFDTLQADMMNKKLDAKYGILFVKKVCQDLLGSWVRLSNGEKAKIVYIDQSRTSAMPIVETESGKFYDTGTSNVKVAELLTYLEAIS